MTVDAWMKYRLAIFKKYCFRSVASQTTKNFKWLIGIDVETPERHKRALKNIVGNNAVLLRCFNKKGMKEAASKYINSNYIANDSAIITSRIDNDDMLRRSYIEVVQRWYTSTHNYGYLCFPHGYMWNTRMELRRVLNVRSPFANYIEENNGNAPKTCLKNWHSRLRGRVFIYTSNRPMWCMVIHGANMASRMTGLKIKMAWSAKEWAI